MILATLLASHLMLAANTEVLDRCEAKLRACFSECLKKDKPNRCNLQCTTAQCEGYSGIDRPLVDFLEWRRGQGRTWI